MLRTSSRWLLLALGMHLGGCCYTVREHADQAICAMAAHPLDVAPLPPADLTAPVSSLPETAAITPVAFRTTGDPIPTAGAELPGPRPLPTRHPTERLQYPPGLPGADAPAIRLPAIDPKDPRNIKEREAAIERLFPPLPPLGPNVEPAPGPAGHPLSLAELQHLALTNSPLIRQAAADVEAAQGAAIQAGAYPNPLMGYEGDQLEQQAAECVAPVPDLEHLRCCHPCSALPDPALKGADGCWPPAIPGHEQLPVAPVTEEERPGPRPAAKQS